MSAQVMEGQKSVNRGASSMLPWLLLALMVREETNLEKLTNELVNVVNETMQPKSVPLWLRPTHKQRNGE